MKHTLLFIISIFFCLAACKHEHEEPHNHNHQDTIPEISFISPELDSKFGLDSVMRINISITSSENSMNSELHGYGYRIINLRTQDTLKLVDQLHNHAETYTIQDSLINQVSDHTDMLLQCYVYINHDQDTVQSQRGFHFHPM